jgi:type II secretory ATPase GspE/PulE/Tfp pilus assembly ATPase PilB-like protein
LLNIVRMANGIVLVTGPTGNGKTTTLYAALTLLNNPTRNIITVEDSIEYELAASNQIQVKTQIGLTFANTLRSIVCQDPDVIMIGEMRDLQTAEIAVHSALTGHHYFSNFSICYRAAVGRLVRFPG